MTRYLAAWRDFSAGLSELANDNMPNNALVQAQNVLAAEGAGISSSHGFSVAYENNGAPVTVGADTLQEVLTASFVVDGAEVQQDMAFAGNALYRYDSEAPTWEQITVTRNVQIFGLGALLDEGGSYNQADYTGNALTVGSDYQLNINGNLQTVTAAAAGSGASLSGEDSAGNTVTITIEGNSLTISCAALKETTVWVSATEAQAGNAGPMQSWFWYGKKLYWLTGEEYYVYDGSTAQSVEQVFDSTDPSIMAVEAELFDRIRESTQVAEVASRWFFARPDSDEVLFTTVGYPGKINSVSSLTASSKHSDHITALKEFNGGLLIFKERSVHYLTYSNLSTDFSTADPQLTQINVSSGTSFPQTVSVINNAVLYLGYDGVYRLYPSYYSSVVSSQNVSDGKLSEKIFTFSPTAAYATVWKGYYRLTMENSQGQEEYRYNYAAHTFWGPFTQDHSCYGQIVQGSGQALVYGCKNGMILLDDEESLNYIATESGDGVALGDALPIPVIVETKGYDITGELVREARVRRIMAGVKQYMAESSNIQLRVQVDYHNRQYAMGFDDSLIYGEGEYGEQYYGWTETIGKEAMYNLRGKRAKFYIYAGGSNQKLLLYWLGIEFKRKRVRNSRERVVRVPVTYDDEGGSL